MPDISRLGTTLIVLVVLMGCATPPLDFPKVRSTAITDTDGTTLAQYSDEWRSGQPGSNGFYPLSQGLDAFGARLALMDQSEVSIDAQYFLMKPDDAGLVFAAQLLDAADRGVRVRLLLDDVFTTVDDKGLGVLDSHPNIEVRIFNPVPRQGAYFVNYLANFERANRRMHNKSLIVDNQVAIVGGRNIAVEYFQLQTAGEFIDFDMLAAGPIVHQVSNAFDRYWNDPLAIPLEALHRGSNPGEQEGGLEWLRQQMAAGGDSIYAGAITTELMQRFYADELPPYYADARLLVDDPEKLREPVSRHHQIVATGIGAELLGANSEIIIYTPYFIPRERGLELIRELRGRGVRIVVVTNSLATNNHTAVHAAYSRYRKDLLKAGVELWEARADAASITGQDASTDLTGLTLHTKGILVDRRLVITGSLNLDPRSIDINTELVLFVQSPELAARLTEAAIESIPQIAYRLQLDEHGELIWQADIDGRPVTERQEPQTTWWQRFTAWMQKIAPEHQL